MRPQVDAARAEPCAEDDSAGPLTGVDDAFGFGQHDSWCLSGEIPAGADLGGVTILRLIGAGGMGRVYEARQEAPRRTVAVKVLREGVVSSAGRERLVREAETLAALRHPGIAQIHTCGTAPAAYGGMPFFVMELVADARPITRFAAARGLSIRSRVALFRRVCSAVAHGHRHQIVHRDLKPANILVDDGGDPKVIDYGIARESVVPASRPTPAAAGGPPEPTGRESCGFEGTLRYMSPEQVLDPEGGIDARADVYALGLVLHELLTGRLPYDLAGKSFAAAARMLGSVAAPGTTPVETLARHEESRDDARALAVVVAKCLEPSPADRYASAGELEADLDRWLDGRAVVARPPTWLESLRRMTRRHRLAVAVAGGLATMLLAAVVAASLLSVRLAGQRQEARAAHARAATEAAAARRQLYASTVLLAAAARDRDNVTEAGNLLGEARRLIPPPRATLPVEISCLEASLDESLGVPLRSEQIASAVAWSPDGTLLVVGDRGGAVTICDVGAGTGGSASAFASGTTAIWSVAFSPDGTMLCAAAADGTVSTYDVASKRLLRSTEGRGQAVYAVAFSLAGDRIATASRDRTARTHDAATGRELAVFRGHEGTVYGAAFSPDGAMLATGGHDATVRLWDAATGHEQATLHGHADRVFAVAFAADGRRLASASEDGTARVWDIVAGTQTAVLRHPARVNGLAFSAAGERLATVAADGIVRVWDAGRGVELCHFRGHTAPAWSVAWAGGDGRLATCGGDGAVRLWATDGRPDVLEAGSRVLCAAYSPDGTTLAAGVDDAEVRLWDAGTLEDRGRLGQAIGRVHGVAWSPDGTLVAGGCDDGALVVWNAATREREYAVTAHSRRIYSVAFAPDGNLVAAASEDRSVSLRDPRTGVAGGPSLKHPRRVFCAAFSLDGTRIATACEDRVVRIWDPNAGAEVRRLEGHTGPVNWLAYGPAGDRLATASSDGTVRLWKTSDGSLERVLAGPAGQVWKVAFTPDGSRLAAAAADGSVHLWDTVSGRSAVAIRGHRDQVWAVAFDPSGRSLVSGSWDGTVRLWGVSIAEIMRRRGGEPR